MTEDEAVPLAGIPRDPAARSEMLRADLPGALDRPEQMRLVYQPRIDLRTRRCVSVEALLRWHHPVLGVVPPGEFIGFLATGALNNRLSDVVFNAAMAHVARVRADHWRVRTSVNVSALSLNVGYLTGRIVELLRRHDLSSDALEVEFTETALIREGERTRRELDQIKGMGVRIALDDFGTGYSNLVYLKHVPADVLKLDRSLVAEIETEERCRIIVRWVIGLAHELGLRIVAEGVETDATLRLLTDWGCDEGQGFYITPPLAENDLGNWLRWHSARQQA